LGGRAAQQSIAAAEVAPNPFGQPLGVWSLGHRSQGVTKRARGKGRCTLRLLAGGDPGQQQSCDQDR